MSAWKNRGVLCLILVPLLAGCQSGNDPGKDDGANTDPSGDQDTDGDTEGDTEGDPSTDPTGAPDDLQACAELPAAALANWVTSEASDPLGVSDATRIADAGRQTWAVALDLLALTDAADHPSIAMSPASMSVALGLTRARYEGDPCGERITEVMGFTEDGDDLHNTFGAAIAELRARALPEEEQPAADPVVLSLQTSVWAVSEGATAPLASELYGAQVHSVVDGELSAINEVMNCVIEAQSDGLLVDFIPPHLPAEDTTAFEVNVAFLQAPWETGLETRGSGEFTRDDGSTVDVERIGSSLIDLSVYQSDAFTSVSLPLRGGKLGVMLVLPPEGTTLEDFTASLEPDALLEAEDEAAWALVDLAMPKVDIPSRTIDYYDPLGFECPPFTLRSVLHGAAVQIDEHGIKAAAATVDESWGTGGEEPVAEVTLDFDRPFLFFVYDEDTQFVLYSGRYAGP